MSLFYSLPSTSFQAIGAMSFFLRILGPEKIKAI